MHTKTGFTLLELLVVVLIIGILVAVAFPQYQVAIDKAEYVQLMSDVDAVKKAEEIYFMANGDYTKDLHDLDIELMGYGDPDGRPSMEHSYWNNHCYNGHCGYLEMKGAIWRGVDQHNERKTQSNIFSNSGRSGALYYVYLDQAYAINGDNIIRPTDEKRMCIARDNHPRSHRVCKALGGKICHDKLMDNNYGNKYCLP